MWRLRSTDAPPPTESPAARGLQCLLKAAAIAGVLVLAFIVRAPAVGDRPMHPDEAVQAFRVAQLLEQGIFEYDPRDLHGPTLYYIAGAVSLLAGATTLAELSETLLRAVPLVASLLIVLLPLLTPGLEWPPRLFASLMLALDSSHAFYASMFIQETLLVLFCWTSALLFARSLISYDRSRVIARRCLFMAALALGLALATKETALLFLLALLVIVLSMRSFRQAAASILRAPGAIAIGAVLLLAPSVILYSSLLMRPGALLDLVLAPIGYPARLSGEGSAGIHRHAPAFFLSRISLFQSAQGPIWFLAAPFLLGSWGTLIAFRKRIQQPQFLSTFLIGALSLFILLVHTLIPYKTPWLLLLPTTGLCIASGLVVERLSLQEETRPILTAVMLLLSAMLFLGLGRQAIWTTDRFNNDPRNPWVYAATSHDITALAERIQEAHNCAGNDSRVDIIATDYWPLPWYLRNIKNVGYWSGSPPDQWAPIMILNREQEDTLGEQLSQRRYTRQYFGLRNEVPVALYLAPEIMPCLTEKWRKREPSQ